MLEPLGQSQVIPYLRQLTSEGVRFTLLSFERAPAWGTEGLLKCKELQRSLAEDGIEWHRLRYHKRPSLPATLYDIAAGIASGQALVRRNRIEMVHVRSTVPAAIALGLKKLLGIKMIFDVRGLVADEYVDADHWEKAGIKYRLTKSMELRCLAACDGVVTLTESIWQIMKEWPELRERKLAHRVVPCCVDLERFRFDEGARAHRRAELEVEDKFVLVYSGSVGGWYLTDKMADFFAVLLILRPDAHFLWLTNNGRDQVDAVFRGMGVSTDRYTIKPVSSGDVPSYLSASDSGISFVKPCFSKLASSPTKNAEYLACGLPLVINAGIGDSDSLVLREGVGALVNRFTNQEYAAAASTILGLHGDVDSMRSNSRAVAKKLFDVRVIGRERYARLYDEVLTEGSGALVAEREVVTAGQ
jgi:glycosyltransferase involved in cell wall biosynthesis